MSVSLDQFYAACPGVILTRDIDAALQALPATANAVAIQAVVLPLIPEGNPPQYTSGAPPALPVPMPAAKPVFAAALPAYPAGMKRFQDSNPAPDGWAIDSRAITDA